MRSAAFTGVMMASGFAFATLTGTAAALGIANQPFTTAIPAIGDAAPHLALVAIAFAALLGMSLAGSRISPKLQENFGNAVEFTAGAIFAAGLALSGMTRPTKVAAFLSAAAPSWDPSLMFVMGGALAVATPAYWLVTKKLQLAKPICCSCFALPTSKTIDRGLILGASLFGAGWGIGGICPGPGLVNLAATPATPILAWNAAMVGGESQRLFWPWTLPAGGSRSPPFPARPTPAGMLLHQALAKTSVARIFDAPILFRPTDMHPVSAATVAAIPTVSQTPEALISRDDTDTLGCPVPEEKVEETAEAAKSK